MKQIVIAITMVTLMMGCQNMNDSESKAPLKTVANVDLQRFMGDWYVISNIPTPFEKGAYNAIETYTWNEKKGIVEVGFRYNADSPEGKLKKMTQRGFIYDKETNAEWRVQPLWPLKLGYLIIDLAEDYSYTVIGVPNRKYIWVMARESTLPEDVYKGILERIAAQGYDPGLIQMVPQVWK